MRIHYPPPVPKVEPDRLAWERAALFPWRMDVKRKLLAERGWTCERDGCRAPATDLDEALVTRGDMRGFSLEQKRIAFASCNLELCCAEHNRNQAQDRDGAWARSCARHGEDAVREWYRSLNLKAPRIEWT